MTTQPLSPSASSDEECYELEYEPECFTIAGKFQVRLLAVVPPPLEYMMSLHSTQQEISGRQVWCGSLVLAHALVRQATKEPDYFKGKRILELGSGTGLVGITVSKLLDDADHKSLVVLTDGDEEAMHLLNRNLSDPFNNINSNRVKATLLRWNEQFEIFDHWCLQQIPADMNYDGDHSSNVDFDIILAGDVMYKKELPQLFFETAKRYMTIADGVLWLCHVPRATVSHQTVISAAQAAGLSIVAVDTDDLVIENCPLEDLSRAVVYQISRS